MSKRVYFLFDSNGKRVGKVDKAAHLPDEWKPENKRKASKTKGKKAKNVFVYTTEECSPKMGKFVEKWSEQPCGSTFWLRDGSKMTIEEEEESSEIIEKFKAIFKSDSRFRCAAVFLTLPQETKEELFEGMTIDAIIGLLKVPIKYHAQFRKVEFGLEQLTKYAKHIAETKSRRHEEKEKEWDEWLEKRNKEYRKNDADKFGMDDDDCWTDESFLEKKKSQLKYF